MRIDLMRLQIFSEIVYSGSHITKQNITVAINNRCTTCTVRVVRVDWKLEAVVIT